MRVERGNLKLQAIVLLVLAVLMMCYGCGDILEGDKRVESIHVAAASDRQQEDEQIEVSGYEEFEAVLLELITDHEPEALIVAYKYNGDVLEDVDRAIDEVMNNDPAAVYAVSNIDGTVTKIVTYFEIDVKIEYKRTKEQMDSIVTVSNQRSLRTELLNIMSDYREEAVFLTSLEVTDKDISEIVREIYYQNPRSIVMMPIIVVEMFSAGGDERFIELRFRYSEQEDVLRQFGASLTGNVRRNALMAEGENDAEILLSLVENLIGACNYDIGAARAISEHGVQNLVATAYNALVRGNAVGEGFAMAFKALCDELGFDCRVVPGHLAGMVHAWNIVSLYGDYYHIDPAMCALNGVETAFLKTDADFIAKYSWDISNTVRCSGTLTYEDIVPGEEVVDDDEEDDEEDGDENGDEDGETDGRTDGETDEDDEKKSGLVDETINVTPDTAEKSDGDTP